MNTGRSEVQIPLGRSAREIFEVNDRLNQTLLEQLDPATWQAKPPGGVRTTAAIFTHMHNVRCKWLRLSAPHLGVPRLLNRAHCTPQQAQEALAVSGARCGQMLAEALDGAGERVPVFLRDTLAKPWHPGLEMLCYMITHEAHHRGQVCMLAHQLGSPLPSAAVAGMWNWEKLWKECGFAVGPSVGIVSQAMG